MRATPAEQHGPPMLPVVDGGPELEKLFRRDAARLLRLARLLGAEDPEDVVQEAFVRLAGSMDRLRADVDPGPYLTTTVVNEVRSRHRRRLAWRRREHLVTPLPQIHGDPDDRHVLLPALRQLSVRQREAVVLRYWADLALTQVAETTGQPLGTVKSHLRRALRRLHELLDDLDD